MEITVKNNADVTKNEFAPEERMKQLQAMDRAERRKERGCIYRKWAQVNLSADGVGMIANKTCDPFVKVWLFIMAGMNKTNALVCSYKAMAEALGLSVMTVRRAVYDLRDAGAISIKRTGSANVYVMNPDIAWKSWSNNRRFCEFEANVILAESEQ